MASDSSGMDVPSAKESNESEGSNDEGGNTDVLNKIRSLFGNEIYESLQKEEINSPELIADLADRDADAPIFGKLGFTYGKAARFKKEFETRKASYGSARARPCSPAPSKPTMAEMSSFTPEMKRLYLSKRKKIGILATRKWGSSCPKFNSPELKTELKEFCTEIASECAIPEINFNEEGIANHVKTFFSEQRRYKKNKSPSTKAAETRKIEATGQRKKPKGGDTSFEEMSGGSSETENSIQGGDTDSVEDEDEEESMLKSPPSSQVPPLPAISALMDKFEQQFEHLDVQSSYMEQAMSDTTTLTVPQGQVDNLMQQVADEAGLELNMELPAGQQQPIGTASAASAEQDELSQRLAKLRQA